MAPSTLEKHVIVNANGALPSYSALEIAEPDTLGSTHAAASALKDGAASAADNQRRNKVCVTKHVNNRFKALLDYVRNSFPVFFSVYHTFYLLGCRHYFVSSLLFFHESHVILYMCSFWCLPRCSGPLRCIPLMPNTEAVNHCPSWASPAAVPAALVQLPGTFVCTRTLLLPRPLIVIASFCYPSSNCNPPIRYFSLVLQFRSRECIRCNGNATCLQ